MFGAGIKVWLIIGVVITGLFLFQYWQLSSLREENKKLELRLETTTKEKDLLVDNLNQNYQLMKTKEDERKKLDEQRRKKDAEKLDKAGSEWGNVVLPSSIIGKL